MLLLSACNCGTSHYVRLPRRWWMRHFFEDRRYYHCTQCKANLFLRREDVHMPPISYS